MMQWMLWTIRRRWRRARCRCDLLHLNVVRYDCPIHGGERAIERAKRAS